MHSAYARNECARSQGVSQAAEGAREASERIANVPHEASKLDRISNLVSEHWTSLANSITTPKAEPVKEIRAFASEAERGKMSIPLPENRRTR